jgi:hypothetical protein
MGFLYTATRPVAKVAGKVMGEVVYKGTPVSPALALRRVQICEQCNQLVKSTRQCKGCWCFIDEKAKYDNQHCKLNKW